MTYVSYNFVSPHLPRGVESRCRRQRGTLGHESEKEEGAPNGLIDHETVEYFIPVANTGTRGDSHHSWRECSKKSVQQGRSHFDARSVHGVREHGKMARTPLAAFFNIPYLRTSRDPINELALFSAGFWGSRILSGPLRKNDAANLLHISTEIA